MKIDDKCSLTTVQLGRLNPETAACITRRGVSPPRLVSTLRLEHRQVVPPRSTRTPNEATSSTRSTAPG